MEGSWNRQPQVLTDWEIQGQGGRFLFVLFCFVFVFVVSFCFNTENLIIVLVTLGFRT